MTMGKSGYLKAAFFEVMLISKVGIVSSVTRPLIVPLTLKFPVVSMLLMFLVYAAGNNAKKSLKELFVFSKVISTSCALSNCCT